MDESKTIKKHFIWTVIILGIIVLIGVFSLIGRFSENKTPTGAVVKDIEEKETTSQDDSTNKEEWVEEKGIFINKLKFKDDKISGEIIKNKFTKKAEISMTMSINNTEEYSDFMGEQVSTAPFMINMACGLFTIAFFNPTALTELQESGNITIEAEEENPLKDYTITKSSLEFLDYEDKTKIADCTAIGGSWEDIKFNVYREYENSFLGMEIGKISEEVEEDK